MFKILTYAYSQTIYSSKKTETACRRDINFMWLLAGRKAPGHSTISRFRCGQRMSVLFYLSFLPPYLLCVKTNKIPRKSHLPGLGIYFLQPEKHPFPGRRSTQFSVKNHKRHLNCRCLMCCCGRIDAHHTNLQMNLNGVYNFLP